MRDSEADTCRKYVLPKLYDSGWTDDQISEQKTFTDGRIIVAGTKCYRKKPKRADYLLRYRRDFLIGTSFSATLAVSERGERQFHPRLFLPLKFPSPLFPSSGGL